MSSFKEPSQPLGNTSTLYSTKRSQCQSLKPEAFHWVNALRTGQFLSLLWKPSYVCESKHKSCITFHPHAEVNKSLLNFLPMCKE